MSDTRARYVPPAVTEGAFNCPHCGALTTQFWFTAHAEHIRAGGKPRIVNDQYLDGLIFTDFDGTEEQLESFNALNSRLRKGLPFVEEQRYQSGRWTLHNIHLSQCYSCREVAIWLYNQLLWPQHGEAPLPNPDLPADIRRDYDEASTILDRSPRGAAALLRLAIQKLCKELGGKGENINADIAALVNNGLDTRVQKALDVVRVIGNNAVHPGQLDLRDDRATVEKLFALVNLIADRMISQPKSVQTMYESLPEEARKAIERRNPT